MKIRQCNVLLLSPIISAANSDHLVEYIEWVLAHTHPDDVLVCAAGRPPFVAKGLTERTVAEQLRLDALSVGRTITVPKRECCGWHIESELNCALSLCAEVDGTLPITIHAPAHVEHYVNVIIAHPDTPRSTHIVVETVPIDFRRWERTWRMVRMHVFAPLIEGLVRIGQYQLERAKEPISERRVD